MIYECTDCKHCANFHGGFRLFCLHPDLPPDAVCIYHPVGDGDAWNCEGFDDNGNVHHFSMEKLCQAEQYSQEHLGEVSYEGIRAWCDEVVR